MSLGPWQIALIVLLLLVLFGRGRISDMMGDFGKGISSFKKGLNEGEQNDHNANPQEKPRIAGKSEQDTGIDAESRTERSKDESAG